MTLLLDSSGNPVTQQIQSVAVTDASGNPVTGIVWYPNFFIYIFSELLISLKKQRFQQKLSLI